jgi:integrase
LNQEAHALFLRAVFDHYGRALRRLMRNARGNYSTDTYAAALPHRKPQDTGESPWQLFQAWIAAKQPADSTVEGWRYMFTNLTDHFSGRSAGSITEDEAREWLHGLITPKRSARTVSRNWKRAVAAVFGWATHEAKRIGDNPFERVRITVPRSVRKREEKSFTAKETATILSASLAIQDDAAPDAACKRWVPWLCAYSGARPGEITQLRGEDVTTQDGIPILHLTPDAGTIKDKSVRSIPIHEHLIEQGFIEWAKARGPGPLFYRPRSKRVETDPTKVKKSPGAQARQRLADWVRAIGVTDRNVSPNHGWRHTFKVIGRRTGISDKHLDDICGHAAPSEGRDYGPTPLVDKEAAIRRFPRFEIDDHPASADVAEGGADD